MMQYAERLKFKIPWKNLYSAPIVAEIDGLYVITGPATGVNKSQGYSNAEFTYFVGRVALWGRLHMNVSWELICIVIKDQSIIFPSNSYLPC